MRSWISALLVATAISVSPTMAEASSLQISPVNIEVPAPGAATKVTVSNLGKERMNAQIRVFKWVQKNGKDELVETRDVVVSPPAMKIAPGKKSIVRVVRTNKAPAATEESYRLIVDEIAPPTKPGQAGVGFTIRYSIPVFFSAQGADTNLQWTAAAANGKLILSARNDGGRRARISSLKVVGSDGKSVNLGSGLAGYVLGGSSKVWVAKSKSIAAGKTVKIIAQSDNGPIETTAKVQSAN